MTLMNRAQILEMIEEEKASLRKLALMFEDLEKTKKRTEERIKEWEELLRSITQ